MPSRTPRTLKDSELPPPPDTSRAKKEKEKAAAPPRTPRYREGFVAEQLTQTYTNLGLMVSLVDADIGGVLVERAEAMATSWDLLCKNNDVVRRRLYKTLQGAGWGTVLAAHVPLALVIGVKAGIVPGAVAAMAGVGGGDE